MYLCVFLEIFNVVFSFILFNVFLFFFSCLNFFFRSIFLACFFMYSAKIRYILQLLLSHKLCWVHVSVRLDSFYIPDFNKICTHVGPVVKFTGL